MTPSVREPRPDRSPRWAIYVVPSADSLLFRLGSALLGYDCRSGDDLAPPGGVDLPADWAALVAPARRYGFHATLKAPFRLASGCDADGLVRAVDALAREPRVPVVIRPVVRALGDFVAVVPAVRDAALDRLAADCVTRLDAFRAPLSDAERARRLAAPLSPRQREHLDRWGYPYVFDDFRFHMTLTGPIAADRRDAVVATLAALLAPVTDAGALPIDRIVLSRQDGADAPFRVVHDAVLSGTGADAAHVTIPRLGEHTA
ncbi:DUF1045 domain-containing protein [Rhodoplanes sp. SY1]|uniref:DUF1045 domain-containing protein n=1 Tax=Rhodoplanes sp. SY1 TaxID=3166646 RepID=UPI0038B66DA6